MYWGLDTAALTSAATCMPVYLHSSVVKYLGVLVPTKTSKSCPFRWLVGIFQINYRLAIFCFAVTSLNEPRTWQVNSWSKFGLFWQPGASVNLHFAVQCWFRPRLLPCVSMMCEGWLDRTHFGTPIPNEFQLFQHMYVCCRLKTEVCKRLSDTVHWE